MVLKMEISILLLFSVNVLINAYDIIPHKMEKLVERFKFGDYYFVFYSKSANWAEAYTICQATRSRLAVVNTPERAHFLADALSQTKTGFEDVWIGGQFSKDTWMWIPISKTITAPHDNFPPWLNYPTKRGKNCLSLDRKKHRDPIFVELKCNLYRPFICEESVGGFIDKFPEGGGEIVINRHHYFLYHGRVTWQEALAYCKETEARLATIPDLDTATKLVELMKRSRPPFENVWIGAKKDNAGWMWVPTGQELSNYTQKDGFPPWRFNAPGEGTMKSCVIMDHHPCLNPYHIHLIRLHRCEEPMFIEEMCDLKKDFLCEIALDETDETNKPNLVIVDKITYIFFEELQTWTEAMSTCEKFNMTLATPETPRQWETIVSHMGELQRPFYHVWLGGKWIPNEWVWLNNHSIPLPTANSTFPPWCLSMNIHQEDEDCINLDRDSHNTPLIYGYNCSMPQSFICQLDGNDSISAGSNTNSVFEYHPNGSTFFEAQYKCKQNHSHLAIVNNSKQAQNVALLLPRDTFVWIGARRTQGVWRWTKTQEIIPDVADDTGYPPWENLNSVLDKSVCLAMKSGYREQPFFIETSCKIKLSYICQFDQIQLPQPDYTLDLNNITYYFYKLGVSWGEALALCESGSLYLVSVGHLELATFLLQGMKGAGSIWTAGKQISEGIWSWITNGYKIPNVIKFGYPPWINNTVPADSEKLCLQLNKVNGAPTFESENCSENRSFVCVDKIVESNETEIQIKNMTVILQDIITNIQKAKKVCTDNGKSVLNITKLDYNNILQLMKSENVKSLWVDVIRKDGKWVYAGTLDEFFTTIHFPDRDNFTVNDLQICLILNLAPEGKLTLVPSLCSDFSRILCISEVNESTPIPPANVEHVINDTATITAILKKSAISRSSLVCNYYGGNMVTEELMQTTIDFFKTLHPAYTSFWIDATFKENGVALNNYEENNKTRIHWLWKDGTPVLLKNLPGPSEANAETIKKHCLVYNRAEDKIIAVCCTDQHSTVCEKLKRKCVPKIQNVSGVIWQPEKCSTEPVSGGTVCQATCLPNKNLIGIQNHICSKGKWSHNMKMACDDLKSSGPMIQYVIQHTVQTSKSSLILFILDYGVQKTVFQASLLFTKNLANTILLNSNRWTSIGLYSYTSKTIAILEHNNCYFMHTIDELERKTAKSNSDPNYHSAFETAEEEFSSKNTSGIIYFFALRPDTGSINRMEIIKRLKDTGIIIVVISIGAEVNRNMLEEIASTVNGTLQLYVYQSLKDLKDINNYLKSKRKFRLSDCPRG